MNEELKALMLRIIGRHAQVCEIHEEVQRILARMAELKRIQAALSAEMDADEALLKRLT